MKPILHGLSITTLVLSCLLPVQAQQSRIAGPIDVRQSVPLAGNVAPLRLAQHGDEGAVEPSHQLPWITMLFRRTPAQEAELTRLLAEQQDPSSPNHRKWLTAEEYASRFGLSQNDMDSVASWLKSQGFRIAYTARDRDFIAFSGTAEQVRSAFHTEIHRYTVGGEAHIMNATMPSVPAALENIVLAVRGLNDFRPKSAAVRSKASKVPADHPSNTGSDGSHSLVPGDIATIYDITPLYTQGFDGSGQNIVVVGQSNISVSDMQMYRSEFSLPGGDPHVIECCTPDPGETGDANETEADLDLQLISGVARNAHVIFVYSTSADLAAQYAIDQDLAPVISESFGTCEEVASSEGDSPSGYRALAQTANSKGITWLAATGDAGATGCDSHDPATLGLSVWLPASIPEVTAVGGTEFNEGAGIYWSAANTPVTLASALSYIPEKAWNDTIQNNSLSSTGGGVSTFFSKPPWQTGAGVPNDGMRDLPDVALAASADHDGYFIYTVNTSTQVHGWEIYGGTSAATPVMASIVTLLNQSQAAASKPKAGNINPALYAFAQNSTTVHNASTIINDIILGSNIVPCTIGTPDCSTGAEGFFAALGYDLATGLGSVDAANLVANWNGGSLHGTTTTLGANPPAIQTNSSTLVTATVTHSGSGTPTGSVSFAANGTALGTSILSGSTASLTVYGSQLSTGSNTIVGTYGGDSNSTGSTGSTTVTVTVPTTNSAVIPSVVPDPVYQQTADAQGYGWFYTVNLTEVAGAATTLTDFTINGTSYASSIASFFGSASMAAHGSLSASLRTKGLTVPTTVVFGFSGRDSNGHLWTQQLQVPFYALQITASVLLTSVPAVVRENMLAGRCPFSPDWYENLGLQEQNGHSVTLNTFKAGQFTFDSTTSTSIQDFFGSTTLPAYGSLLAGICWPDLTPPVTEAYEIDGTDDLGNPISARTSVLFDVPPPSGATLSVGSPSISLTVASASQTASTTLSVDVAPGSPWTISVFPLNRTTRWLGVYPLSGIGPGSVTVSGFDPALTGTDNATLAVQAVNAFPQFINVPVTLSVGGGSSGGTTGWIIPQVVDGGGLPAGWQTTFGVTNTNLTTANATLQFFQTNASGNTQAWNLPLIENVSTNNMQLAPGETIFLHTPDTAPTLTQGFGELIADPGVVAYAIFTLHVPGRQNQDGTALAAAPGLQTMIPFDNAVGFTTTIAVVNASGSPEILSAVLTLKNGQTVTSSLPAIPARGHAAFALAAQFPQSVGQEGTLTLTSSSGAFSVIALRFNPTGAFTALPVYVLVPEATSPTGNRPIQNAATPAGPNEVPAEPKGAPVPVRR